MLNRKVEELFREEKCSRNADSIKVTFLASFKFHEEYKIEEYIEQNGKTIYTEYHTTIDTRKNSISNLEKVDEKVY